MQPSSKDISIVIVNYNVKKFLHQCLRSIETAKKELDIEVIVVDNNSTDGSIEYLAPLFPQVNFISLDENLGFASANNIGLVKSSGKYILILNPDTLLEENTLIRMIEYMQANPEVGIAGCKVLNPDGSFQLACRRGFPTPWASFSKLFGLQKLFPHSKLFAKYNQTFRSPDKTYYIDAVVGAFMFCRKSVLEQLGGFDTDFFMYGEDIDLCFRASKAGWKVAYVHDTSIIHFKGESTKRSPINEVKHFYKAMEIFTQKHYSRSILFLALLRLGIFIRSIFAYTNKHFKDFAIIILDIIAVNASFLIATYIRRKGFFALPDYAYPTVFIVITLIMLGSMIAVGEYFETKPTIRKSFFGLMLSFFFLSSLTYFFKQYAFSRGILLMTIGFTAVVTVFFRIIISIIDRTKGKEASRKIAIVGVNRQAENLIKKLRTGDYWKAEIVGLISAGKTPSYSIEKVPILGDIEYLGKIIDEYNLNEIIITEPEISKNQLMQIVSGSSNPSVRFHIAQEFEDVLTSQIIEDVAGIEPTIPKYNITKLRYRIVKRSVDIIGAFFILTIGLTPLLLYLFFRRKSDIIKKIWLIFTGSFSFIGIFPEKSSNGKSLNGISWRKPGLGGLVHVSNPERLSDSAIRSLNNYYLQNYNFSLDIDIFLKLIIRKKRGN